MSEIVKITGPNCLFLSSPWCKWFCSLARTWNQLVTCESMTPGDIAFQRGLKGSLTGIGFPVPRAAMQAKSRRGRGVLKEDWYSGSTALVLALGSREGLTCPQRHGPRKEAVCQTRRPGLVPPAGRSRHCENSVTLY